MTIEVTARMLSAACVQWCCAGRCAYVEAGRAPECEPMVKGKNGNWLRDRMRDAITAALNTR